MDTIRYHVKIDGIPRNSQFSFREEVEYRALVAAFKATAKNVHISAKRRSYASAFSEFKKLYQPAEWYCRTRQGPNFKDDSIEVWYTVAKKCVDCSEAIEYLADFPGPRCLTCHAKIQDALPLERPDFKRAINLK